MIQPAVSVLLAVRNGMPWLPDAVASMLGQTYGAFTLLIVDDGSTDATASYLAGLDDTRVIVLSQAPAGLTRSLTRVLSASTAPLVARMDADDVAAPDRLERQVAFLEANPEVGLLGTWSTEVTPDGRVVRVEQPAVDHAALRRALIRRNPFAHSSVMFRRSLVEAVGGYDESFSVAQDYDLWLRLSRVTRVANLPQPLVTRRLLRGSVTRSRDSARLWAEARARLRAVGRGEYPGWCVVFALRPLVALAVPSPMRVRLRRLMRMSRPYALVPTIHR